MQVKPSQALTMIATLIRAKLVPLLIGSPGIGKSQLYQHIADQYNLLLIDIRLGQCDVTDLCGFPMIQGKKAGYVPMNTFPIEGDPLPINPATGLEYAGWFILFDELTSAAPALQAASYKILLDRMVGIHPLHKNVAMGAAGNKETDNAIVEPMSTALQSRLVHLELAADPQEWTKWAIKKGIDHRIISFIEFQPNLLYTFKPDHTDSTYACPRTWEFTDRILKLMDVKDHDMMPLLAGTITHGVAHEFLVFCTIFDSLPSIHDIIAAPEAIRVSSEPSILYAISGSMAHHASAANMDQLMKYIKRLPIEFQIVCVRMTLGRDKTLVTNADVQKWLEQHATELF